MAKLNVHGICNLTADPETRTPEGRDFSITNARAAFNWKDRKGEKQTTFVTLSIFGKSGEAFAKFHSKGKPAYVESGHLSVREYNKKDGSGKGYEFQIRVDEWSFVPGGERAENSPSQSQPKPAAVAASDTTDDDDFWGEG